MNRQLAQWTPLLATLCWAGTLIWASPVARRTAIVQAVERARPAVVSVQSERTVRNIAGDDFGRSPHFPRSSGMGTGIILDPRGYILTNYHVVEDVSSIRVVLVDGTSYPARLVARDRENDLVLLKIEVSRSLPTIPIGTSSDLMLGETVIAIGNAFGYEHSVTVGVISALGRNVKLNPDIGYKGLIQTDASINPGNSGGPLLNVEGELIGVNVAIRAGAQGIAFALPIDHVLRVAAELFASLRPSEIRPGLTLRDCVDVSDPNRSARRWVQVEQVEPGSPAAQAGIQPGDILLEANGWKIAHGLDWERALLHIPEDVLRVRLRRGQEERTVQLALQRTSPDHRQAELVWRILGLRLSPVSAQQVRRVQSSLRGGMLVTAVAPNSAADRAGIQPGDILIGLHLWETLNYDNLAYVLQHPERANFLPLRYFLIRQGTVQRGYFQLSEEDFR